MIGGVVFPKAAALLKIRSVAVHTTALVYSITLMMRRVITLSNARWNWFGVNQYTILYPGIPTSVTILPPMKEKSLSGPLNAGMNGIPKSKD